MDVSAVHLFPERHYNDHCVVNLVSIALLKRTIWTKVLHKRDKPSEHKLNQTNVKPPDKTQTDAE